MRDLYKATETIMKELDRQFPDYKVNVHAIQMVKEGYIAIYDTIFETDGRESDYERLAFFNLKLEHKNDIILK